MEYFLTEEQQMIKKIAGRIAREIIAPITAKCDEEGLFPAEAVKAFACSDLCGVYIEEKYGGLGGGIFELALVIEELSKVCGGTALILNGSALGTIPIMLYGSAEQKEKYLPHLASGKKLAAFGLTEANAGSDIAGMESRAVLEERHYIINGTKQMITNAGEADIYVIIASTDKSKGAKGLSAFIVEKETPGFSFGKKEDKMGVRASTTRGLIFDDCRIPQENLLAAEGMGFKIAMDTLDRTRPGIAAQAVGIAQGAFEESLRYAKERKQFGQPIASFQAVQHMLADMAMRIEAARCLLYQVCRHIDSGAERISQEAAMVKATASDTAMKVTVDAVQILGGYGYLKEYPVEKMMRDAKITQIYEGTNQILKNVIARELLK